MNDKVDDKGIESLLSQPQPAEADRDSGAQTFGLQGAPWAELIRQLKQINALLRGDSAPNQVTTSHEHRNPTVY